MSWISRGKSLYESVLSSYSDNSSSYKGSPLHHLRQPQLVMTMHLFIKRMIAESILVPCVARASPKLGGRPPGICLQIPCATTVGSRGGNTPSNRSREQKRRKNCLHELSKSTLQNLPLPDQGLQATRQHFWPRNKRERGRPHMALLPRS